jgi:hypothetical protein
MTLGNNAGLHESAFQEARRVSQGVIGGGATAPRRRLTLTGKPGRRRGTLDADTAHKAALAGPASAERSTAAHPANLVRFEQLGSTV